MAVTGTGTGVWNLTASGDQITTLFIMDSCRWVGATAAGDKCLFTNLNGDIVWRSEADGPNFVDGWVFDSKWMNGAVMSSMNSGTMQIYEARK
jgi:hypothetical protein